MTDRVPSMENAESQRPVAARVAANVRMLRNERGLDLADVSETMTALGRPLSLNGLSKVERGKRGIDVDDLVALALALDVSPLRLLLTPEAGEDQVALTVQVNTSERRAWEWAAGLTATANAANAANAAGVPWPIIYSYLDMTRNAP